MNNFIQKIKFPIQKSNILPCTQQICYCIEYLDFGKKNDVILIIIIIIKKSRIIKIGLRK